MANDRRLKSLLDPQARAVQQKFAALGMPPGMDQEPKGDDELWADLVAKEGAFIAARTRFITEARDGVSVLCKALSNGRGRSTAFALLTQLNLDVVRAVLPELLVAAMLEPTFIGGRESLFRLSAAELTEGIRTNLGVLLAEATDEIDYRVLVGLVSDCGGDQQLFEAIAAHAERSDDADIREIASDLRTPPDAQDQDP